MRLEEDFRFNLQGQLSHEKTEIDVAIASRIAREFAVLFSDFVAENYSIEFWDNGNKWFYTKNGKNYTSKQILKIYEKIGN
jgi:hypothetical protein